MMPFGSKHAVRGGGNSAPLFSYETESEIKICHCELVRRLVWQSVTQTPGKGGKTYETKT